jgi:predicted HicB family RNase H-like nuclease
MLRRQTEVQEALEARFMLRVPESIRTRVEQSARNHRRSMNSEIIVLLERALPAEENKAATGAETPAAAE